MKDPIQLEYTLNEELWRQFFAAHYQRQGFFRLRYGYGLLLLLAGAYLAGGPPAKPWLGGGFVLSGLYCILSMQLLILKSLSAARKGPLFSARLAVSIGPQGLVVQAGKHRSERPWTAVRGYCLVAPGIMLYLDKNAFFFIPKQALNATTAGLLQRCFEQCGLQRL